LTPAFAQSRPARTIRIIVPFPAGGSADLSARLLAEHLKMEHGQPVIVENRVGAGGNLAAAEAAHVEADGYTLFLGTNGTQTINQSLYRTLPYDPAADFTAIGMMWQAPHLVVVSQSLPVDSLGGLIAYARANPGKLSYGSSGIGSSTHLFGELFKTTARIDIAHIPYRGQGPALNDLLSEQIQLMFPIVPDVISHIRSGSLRALALASAKASDVLPELPLIPDLGYPDLVASAWTALYVPVKTPVEVIERLGAELATLLMSSDFVTRMKRVGIEIRPMRPDEFEAFTRHERARWAVIIEALKLKLE
jgi:tripartite-type tricarboxylate transporter receptor subunit TctC